MNRSLWALNILNFLLAQIAAVVVPFLNVFLKQHGWHYDQIGFAMAVAGLGSMIFQIPAGIICDRFAMPKRLLVIATISLGTAYVLIPQVIDQFALLMPFLFITGMMGTFFAPLLGTLALSLVGRRDLHKILGKNQSFGHFGGVAASILAAVIVRAYGIGALFYLAGAISLIAAGTVSAMGRTEPVDQATRTESPIAFLLSTKSLLSYRDIRVFLLSLVLFFLATGTSSATVGLYMKDLGSPDDKIAWISLVSQPVMIPVAWIAGKYASAWGRKPWMLIALFFLALRFLLYAFAKTENQVLLITALDGITSGIASLITVLICSDLTAKRGMFNSLMGLVNSIPAAGAVVGVSLQGVLIQQFGFHLTLLAFAAVSIAAAAFFLIWMPETRNLIGDS